MLSVIFPWSRSFYSFSEMKKQIKDSICSRIAWWLPKRLIYWAMIRGSTYGTVGKYGNIHPTEITATEALCRWHQDHRL